MVSIFLCLGIAVVFGFVYDSVVTFFSWNKKSIFERIGRALPCSLSWLIIAVTIFANTVGFY
jgi:branched-subunit amino acid permease